MEYCSPISIQFVWHPKDNTIVKPIVDYCKTKLSRDINKPFLHALDFPIFCYTSTDSKELPSKINRMSKETILFVFISNSNVSSDEWNDYLCEQINEESVFYIPIALNENGLNHGTIEGNGINALRYYDYERKYKHTQKSLQFFFIAIAHEIYRWILSNDEDHTQLQLFLSHTKNDKNGLELAKCIKSFIDSDTTLDTFFDTNDINVGNGFNEVIEKNIEKSTFIIFHSDNYSSRYWCQKEMIYAKNKHRPIISIDLIENWEDRSFPLMCNYPNIRYNDNILDILELALLETIRFFYCNKLMNNYKLNGYILEESDVFNCVPDGFAINNSKKDLIFYPEPELYPDEIEVVSYGKKLKTPLSFSMSDISQKRVGISISKVSEKELIILGQDDTHLKKLSQILAKKFLNCGSTLIYGGDLRKDGFTRYLFEEALIVKDRTKRKGILIKDYIAWPVSLLSEQSIEEWSAEFNNVCRFEIVSHPSDLNCLMNLEKLVLSDSDDNRYIWSRCLTCMREKMISDCDIRICAGGKCSGYKGCMPGVLEEIKIAIDYKKPLYLLGGFGGITEKVCRYLMDKSLPEELTQEWQIKNNPNSESLLQAYKSEISLVDYSWVKNISIDSLHNGLDQEDNCKLFTTPFVDEAVYLISKGLRNMFPNKSI